MKFKFICYYWDNVLDCPLNWKDSPKVKIINAKNEEEAARKFEAKYSQYRLVLVTK